MKTQHSPGLLPRSKELHVNKGLFAAPPGRREAGPRGAQAPEGGGTAGVCRPPLGAGSQGQRADLEGVV